MPHEINWGIFAVACFALAAAAFFLGWDIAEDRGAKARKELANRLKWEQINRTELTKYVREHWPNEYEAYQLGHSEGYQQGVLQSPDLEE